MQKTTIAGFHFFQHNGAWIAEDTIMGENLIVFPGALLGRPPIPSKTTIRRVDPLSLPSTIIGENCIIGANCVVYRGASIGNDCLLGDTARIRELVRIGPECMIAMGVTISYNTTIGSRVKVMDNTYLTGNMTVEDDVFIGMLVTMANDNSMGRQAALGIPPEQLQRQGPVIRRCATIGQGACILPGVEIGENAIVGANAVVTSTVPPRVLALGVPAKVVRDLRADEIKR